VCGASHAPKTAGKQQMFDTPKEAFDAFISAVRSGDSKALLGVLGPDAGPLVSSGDPVADKQRRERFVKEYDESNKLQAGGGKIVLVVGKEEFPFAIPLVPAGPQWRFDTAAGREEILNRRIGRNELAVIQVCLAYADAQRDYYSQYRDGSRVLQYAQHMVSRPGKHDGLYWPTKPGEAPSPLGDLVAQARAEGYGVKDRHEGPTPYHGYFYRILTVQGRDAPGGAYDYVADGKMIGGFALVAFPAQWSVSGVMTFLVSHDGVVYQKDLGPKTADLARQMKLFNPDKTWQRVDQ